MENASKALIIAGEVLIGVLILSLASFVITQFGSFSRNLNNQMSETEIRSFNVNFTNFSGRANISMQEVATIINYAKKNNAEYEVGRNDPYFVDVIIDDTSVVEDININEFLDTTKNNTYYSCNVQISNINTTNNENEIRVNRRMTDGDIVYNESTRRVCSITFHSITNTTYINAILQHYTILWNE